MATKRGRVVGTRRVAQGARKATKVVSSASGGRSRAAQVEAQNIALLGPWLGLIAGAVVGQLVHASFVAVGDWAWLEYVGLGGATGMVAYAAWHTTKSRSTLALSHTLATVIGAGIWLMFAATTGLLHMEYVSWWLWRVPVPDHPTFDLWWMFGGAAAICWNIRQGVSREHAIDAQNVEPDAWEQAGLAGVKGTVKPVNEFKMQGLLTLPPGMTVENVQGSSAALESAMGWPRGKTRILPAPGPQRIGQRAKALAVVMTKDPLAQAVPWPGVVIKRNMNLMSLIPTGVDADGDEGGHWVCQPEGTKHGLVQGMTGSGKSEGEKPVVLYTAALGAVNIILDTVKQTQTFGPLAPALHWLAVDEGTAKAILRRIAKEVIPARTEYLSFEGLSKWSLKSKLSLLRLHIEEAWDLVETDEIIAIALAARSAGIQLTISLQRASHDMISTTVREQLGTRRCYGLAGGFGVMILDDDVVEAGADPEQWKDTAPGMHYMTRGQMTLEEKVQARRSYADKEILMDCNLPCATVPSFAEVAAKIGPKLKPMDEITAKAFGPLWANRTTPLEIVARVSSRHGVTKRTGEALQNASRAASVVSSRDAHPARVIDPIPDDVETVIVDGEEHRLMTGDEVKRFFAEDDGVEVPAQRDAEPAALPGVNSEVLGFLAHLSGSTPEEMAEVLKIYTSRNGDVEDITNGTEIDDDVDGDEDMHVVDNDDFMETERSADGRTMTIRTPGMRDLVLDYGVNAPDAEDIELLDRVDPDAPPYRRDPAREPLRLGVPSEHAWPKDRFDAALMARFEQLKKEGKTVVKGGDFAEVIAEAGWARTVIYPRLRNWERELGIVTETDDGFIVVRG